MFEYKFVFILKNEKYRKTTDFLRYGQIVIDARDVFNHFYEAKRMNWKFIEISLRSDHLLITLRSDEQLSRPSVSAKLFSQTLAEKEIFRRARVGKSLFISA